MSSLEKSYAKNSKIELTIGKKCQARKFWVCMVEADKALLLCVTASIPAIKPIRVGRSQKTLVRETYKGTSLSSRISPFGQYTFPNNLHYSKKSTLP